ncbi:dihydroorotate dehydrogenase [Rhodobacter sp. Har01]|uniref:dihydroorotate dehydrogenase n=1 Tax=Rhodobacter sp. Har01 TaxID=2883999 RepID=UPI001D07B067|nr:dihydroorotate dehydrogenase [Rhodobacter sp. Har01]MCB6178353.1 dihydroorotate dehydrogenase [Rhodobacter sp. Har01]
MRDPDLDRLLAEARTTPPPPPSEDFLARVLAEAHAEQPRPAATGAPAGRTPALVRTPRRPGLRVLFASAFGGAGVVAGLGCAAALGLVVGYANPATLGWLTNDYLSSSVGIELVPVAEVFLSEG